MSKSPPRSELEIFDEITSIMRNINDQRRSALVEEFTSNMRDINEKSPGKKVDFPAMKKLDGNMECKIFHLLEPS